MLFFLKCKEANIFVNNILGNSNKKQKSYSHKLMLSVASLVVLIRLIITLLPSFRIDMGGYHAWSEYLADVGSKGMYEYFHIVYAPGYLYFLWITGLVSKLLLIPPFWHKYLIKIWAVAFDFLGAFLIYKIGEKYNKPKTGFVLGVSYALNPGVFFNSSIWGQFDSIPATMLFAVVYCFNLNRKVTAAILFVVAVLFKPQSGLLAPVVLVQFYRDFLKFRNITPEIIKKNVKNTIYAVIGGISTYIVLIFPFYYHTGFYSKHVNENTPVIKTFLVETMDYFYWLFNLYRVSIDDYPYATANAFNLWVLTGGQTVPDSNIFLLFTYAKWGFIISIPAFLLTLVFLVVKRNSVKALYFSSFFILAAFFTFFTRMHERYLLPSIIFLTVCVLWDKWLLIPLAIISACVTANHWYIYYREMNNINVWFPNYDRVAMPFSFLTVMVVLLSVVYMIWLMKKQKIPLNNTRRQIS